MIVIMGAVLVRPWGPNIIETWGQDDHRIQENIETLVEFLEKCTPQKPLTKIGKMMDHFSDHPEFPGP